MSNNHGMDIQKYLGLLAQMDPIRTNGRVTRVVGLMVESEGPDVNIGECCFIHPAGGKPPLKAEVVGFRDNKVLLMPLGELDAMGPGCDVVATGSALQVKVGPELLGKVLNGLGEPLDGAQLSPHMPQTATHRLPPNPLQRPRIQSPMSIGVRAIDGLLTVGKGQRVGIFAGSGVGKSTLLGMIARNTSADVNVIALIGERGREVNEFLYKDLGEEGLKRSVVVVATSDQPALVRIKGAMIATSIAEYFRDRGFDVMLMMDSVTRYAMAQREVGLAVGEPPATRGYTPSVFANLPKLLERSGTSANGSITAFYTVLVDGDDMNDPIADTTRGILDGHIVLSRELSQKGHFPAIDVLASVSRVMKDLVSPEQHKLSDRIKRLMAVYQESEDLIQIGAYQKGANPQIDEAIRYIDYVRRFTAQATDEKCDFAETIALMHQQFKEL